MNCPTDDADFGDNRPVMSMLWLKCAPPGDLSSPAMMHAARLFPAMAVSAAVSHAKWYVECSGVGMHYEPPIEDLARNLAEWPAFIEAAIGMPLIVI